MRGGDELENERKKERMRGGGDELRKKRKRKKKRSK
jgi:hypothetical protein